MHDELVIYEGNLAESTEDESEYMSSESVTHSDDSDDVTGCSASMDYDSPGSDLVNDPDDDPVSSNTAPVLLIMAFIESALQHHIPRIAFCTLLGIKP